MIKFNSNLDPKILHLTTPPKISYLTRKQDKQLANISFTIGTVLFLEKNSKNRTNENAKIYNALTKQGWRIGLRWGRMFKQILDISNSINKDHPIRVFTLQYTNIRLGKESYFRPSYMYIDQNRYEDNRGLNQPFRQHRFNLEFDRIWYDGERYKNGFLSANLFNNTNPFNTSYKDIITGLNITAGFRWNTHIETKEWKIPSKRERKASKNERWKSGGWEYALFFSYEFHPSSVPAQRDTGGNIRFSFVIENWRKTRGC